MNTHQIHHILSNESTTRKRFQGVYPSDRVPKNPPKPAAFVANLDPHNSGGSHWVAFYLPSHGPAEYYDSYGTLPIPPFKKLLGQNYKRSIRTLQSPFSAVCGQYCIFFILKRCNGQSMHDIISTFGEDVTENDFILNYYIKNRFDIDLDVFDLPHLLQQISKAKTKE